MTLPIRILAAAVASLIFFVQAGSAGAADIKVLCASGFRIVMDDLRTAFERAGKHKLVLSYATQEVTVKQIRAGETGDVVVLPRDGVDAIVTDGNAVASTVSPVARVGISVAVATGAPKPNIASPDAFKHALVTAKSITYLDPAAGGANGILIANMLDQLGIAKEMKQKAILPTTSREMEGLLTSGKAEIAVNQTALLLMLSGIDIVGPMPPSLYPAIVFTAAVMKSARDAAAAREFIDFLRGPEAAKGMESKGMESAR